jgi:hypothetical protein
MKQMCISTYRVEIELAGSKHVKMFIGQMVRRVWRYQRGNQNPYIEEEQTTQWPKEKVQKEKQRSTKHAHKTKDQVTRTPLKTGGELMCYIGQIVYMLKSRLSPPAIINHQRMECSTDLIFIECFMLNTEHCKVSIWYFKTFHIDILTNHGSFPGYYFSWIPCQMFVDDNQKSNKNQSILIRKHGRYQRSDQNILNQIS